MQSNWLKHILKLLEKSKFSLVSLVGKDYSSEQSVQEVICSKIFENVLCSHGCFNPNTPTSPLSKDALSQLLLFFDAFLGLGISEEEWDAALSVCAHSGTPSCLLCSEENEFQKQQSRNVLSTRYSHTMILKNLLKSRTDAFFPSAAKRPDPGKYFLIPKDWYEDMRSFCSGELDLVPSSIPLSEFVCVHNRLKYELAPLSIQEGGLKLQTFRLISSDQWTDLESLYGVDCDVKGISFIVYKKHLRQSDEDFYELIRSSSSPQSCCDCVQARLYEEIAASSSFQNGRILLELHTEQSAYSKWDESEAKLDPNYRVSRLEGRSFWFLDSLSSEDSAVNLQLRILEKTNVDPGNQLLLTRYRTIAAVEMQGKRIKDLGIRNHSVVRVVPDFSNGSSREDFISLIEQDEQSSITRKESSFRGSVLLS